MKFGQNYTGLPLAMRNRLIRKKLWGTFPGPVIPITIVDTDGPGCGILPVDINRPGICTAAGWARPTRNNFPPGISAA